MQDVSAFRSGSSFTTQPQEAAAASVLHSSEALVSVASELPATTLRPTVVVVVGKSNTPLIYSFSTLEPLTRVVLFNVKY